MHMALLVMVITLYGCVSVQFASGDGKPKLIGFGSVKRLTFDGGQVYRVVAPGISVRFYTYAPGLSLGLHETKLFYPLASGQDDPWSTPVAIENRCAGINFTPTEIMFGIERSFAIPLPSTEKSVIQFISYSASNLANTVVDRKEVK
jgi:hypothetical protein